MDSQKQKNEVFNEFYKSYNREILYLRREGSKLLQKIKLQETKMNLRKQQKLKPLLREVNLLIFSFSCKKAKSFVKNLF